MKALSIQQPWAWLIVNGLKNIENRSWPTNMRGWVLVHAGKRIDHESLEDMREDFIFPDEFLTGGIVGAMYVVDCVEDSRSDWFAGPYGFEIGKAVELPFVPIRGQLGFFDVPNSLLPANLTELLQ